MTRQEIVLEHLKDLMFRIAKDMQDGNYFYDEYNGYDDNGTAFFRNTGDLLSSLRWLSEMLDIS